MNLEINTGQIGLPYKWPRRHVKQGIASIFLFLLKFYETHIVAMSSFRLRPYAHLVNQKRELNSTVSVENRRLRGS